MQTEQATPTGRRRTTAPMIAAQAARPTSWGAAKRGVILSALKRAAPALGIPRRVVDLMDYLVGRTLDGDWIEGEHPVAWPSNETLQDALDLGRTQVKSLTRMALEYGLLEMRDSPNGRRYGRREAGRIVDAYGFDLSPLAARFAEFQGIAAAHEEARREGGRLRGQITALRNRILSLTDAGQEQQPSASADWQALAVRARQLAMLRGDSREPAQLAPILAQLADLVAGVTAALAQVEAVGTDPTGAENRPPLTPTNHLLIAKANTAAEEPNRPSAYEVQSSRDQAAHRAAAVRTDTTAQDKRGKEQSALRGFVATPEFLLKIAPAFRGWVRSARPSWGEMEEAATYVRSDLGISQHAWGQACVTLGRLEAVVMLAAISARHGAGKVRSAGGLLRRMVELHQGGTLRLDRTLFGLADSIEVGRHEPPQTSEARKAATFRASVSSPPMQ